MTIYAPSFTAARLYRKTSKSGSDYFVGRWGGAKITLLKSRETADDGGEIWELKLSEAAPYQPKAKDDGRASPGEQQESGTETKQRAPARQRCDAAARADWQRPPSAGHGAAEVEIPFAPEVR